MQTHTVTHTNYNMERQTCMHSYTHKHLHTQTHHMKAKVQVTQYKLQSRVAEEESKHDFMHNQSKCTVCLVSGVKKIWSPSEIHGGYISCQSGIKVCKACTTISNIIKRSEGRRRKTHQCDYSNMPNCPALSSVEKALAWLDSPFLRGVVELVLVHIGKGLTTSKQTKKKEIQNICLSCSLKHWSINLGHLSRTDFARHCLHRTCSDMITTNKE